MKIRLLSLLSILSLSLSSAYCEYKGSAYVIKGKAEVKVENLFTCENGNSRMKLIVLRLRFGFGIHHNRYRTVIE